MTLESDAGSDLTPLFKSCVKTIRTRNKVIGVALSQTKIFPSSPTPFSQFYSRSKDLMSNIVSHHNLLKDHQKKYLKDKEQSMSDYECSYMEKVVSTNLRIIDDNLRTLATEVVDDQLGSKDAIEYQQVIIVILKMHFQEINFIFKHLKELGKKKQKEKDSLYRLHRPGGIRKRVSNDGSDPSSTLPNPSKLEKEPHDSQRQSTDSQSINHTSQEQQSESREGQEMEGMQDDSIVAETMDKSVSTSLLEEEVENMLEELSGEERQILEQENAHLYKEFRSNQEEVRQITRQVVELGQMQDLLSENVDLQAHQIEEIQETIMTSTENVREGNEQVREAMRKDAGFRVWIMFFLIVMSCTILFLDWYNS